MKIQLFVLGVACSLMFGCEHRKSSYQASPSFSSNLALAKSKWAYQKTQLGTYRLSIGFFNGFGGDVEYVSMVDAPTGEITDCTEVFTPIGPTRTPRSSTASPSECETVETMFQKIEDAISLGKLLVAEYDPNFGYPTQIEVDLDNPTILPDGSILSVADAPTAYAPTIQFDALVSDTIICYPYDGEF